MVFCCIKQDFSTKSGFKGGENGTLERGFWLEMMEKYYHKLLSPPWAAAAGVIYELVYGLRHAGVIACSSAVQCRLQPASAKALLCSPHSWEETGPHS